MSSVIGHAAAGTAAFLACNRFGDRRARWVLPVFVFLAICPDLDYLAWWGFHARATPRFTHSLVFCVAVAWLAWLALRRSRWRGAFHAPLAALLAASLSHLVLDFLVGVHPLPLLWPLADPNVSPPLGILPSAGRLRFGNPYLWRNLLIELAVLLPVLALLVAIARSVPARRLVRVSVAVAPVWLAFLAWSLMLKR